MTQPQPQPQPQSKPKPNPTPLQTLTLTLEAPLCRLRSQKRSFVLQCLGLTSECFDQAGGLRPNCWFSLQADLTG